MQSKPAETRLNYMKNFNHFNKDQEGGMEIFAPRSNSEINRINKEIFGEQIEEDEDGQEIEEVQDELGEDELSYPEIDDEGLQINSDGEIIPRQHSYPYGFGTPPSPTFNSGKGIESTTHTNILTFENYMIENSEWLEDVLTKVKSTEYESVSDEYFTMKLKDINYGDKSAKISVVFSENHRPESKGTGIFKYKKSEIPTLSGDIDPIKMTGLLEEMFYEDERIIFYFIEELMKKINY
jgi:hypothetical protein